MDCFPFSAPTCFAVFGARCSEGSVSCLQSHSICTLGLVNNTTCPKTSSFRGTRHCSSQGDLQSFSYRTKTSARSMLFIPTHTPLPEPPFFYTGDEFGTSECSCLQTFLWPNGFVVFFSRRDRVVEMESIASAVLPGSDCRDHSEL